jgi:hypothetical protein
MKKRNEQKRKKRTYTTDITNLTFVITGVQTWVFLRRFESTSSSVLAFSS